MPISDYLLTLALALHPASSHSGALILGPDSIVQPVGGVASAPTAAAVPWQKRSTDAGSKDPAKSEFVKGSHVKPAYTRYKHGAHSVPIKGKHIKGEHIKQPMVIKGNNEEKNH